MAGLEGLRGRSYIFLIPQLTMVLMKKLTIVAKKDGGRGRKREENLGKKGGKLCEKGNSYALATRKDQGDEDRSSQNCFLAPLVHLLF